MSFSPLCLFHPVLQVEGIIPGVAVVLNYMIYNHFPEFVRSVYCRIMDLGPTPGDSSKYGRGSRYPYSISLPQNMLEWWSFRRRYKIHAVFHPGETDLTDQVIFNSVH